jgi:hypothetical protein
MTDAEMIKLLRNSPFTFNDIVADRIEALVADVAGWISNAQAASGWASEAEYKLEAAEKIGRAFEEDAGQLRAKLAKAIDVIKDIINIAPDGDDDEWRIMLDDAQYFITELDKK